MFCLYAEMDPERADALDIYSWEFYVLATPTIYAHFGEYKTVRLGRKREIDGPVGYDELRERVNQTLPSWP